MKLNRRESFGPLPTVSVGRCRWTKAGVFVVFVFGVVSLASCGGDTGGGARSQPLAPVDTSGTTTSVPVGPARSCSGEQIESASVVALDAADGRFCWSAVQNWNATVFAVDEGKVLLTGYRCRDLQAPPELMALDAVTGEQLWSLTLPRGSRLPGHRSSGDPPQLSAGHGVVVTPIAKGVAGVDLSSGQVRWTVEGVAPLVAASNFVIGVTENQVIVTLDRVTGQERWRTAPVDGFYGSVAVDSANVLVGVPGATVAYDAATGQRRWEAPFGPASDTFSVRIMDGVVTGTSTVEPDAGGTYAFDIDTAAASWTSPAHPVQQPEPTDGNFYVDLEPGMQVAALDARSGRVRWQAGLDDYRRVLHAGPGLAVLTSADELTGLDPQTGQCRAGRSPPVRQVCRAARPAQVRQRWPPQAFCRRVTASSSASATASGVDRPIGSTDSSRPWRLVRVLARPIWAKIAQVQLHRPVSSEPERLAGWHRPATGLAARIMVAGGELVARQQHGTT